MFTLVVDRSCHHEVKLWRLLVMDCIHSRCVGGSDMLLVIGNSHRCRGFPRECLAARCPTDNLVVVNDDGDGQCAGSKRSQLKGAINANASAKTEVARAERDLVYGRL